MVRWILIVCALAAPIAAQGCEVEGKVAAWNGLRIPRARLLFTPKEGDTRAVVEGTTNEKGEYKTDLAAGEYDLQVLAAGFRRYQKDVSVRCANGQAMKVDVMVEIGMTR